MSTDQTWRKSSRSAAANTCVELSVGGTRTRVRDSKNPTGPVLKITFGPFLAAIKSGRLGA
ncbi:MAG TPA: DUF397 domain-containing protein [Actinophytocola sp.]|jgi:hypothetical protein|uniref:DUF397 domain-containing protein n=1 Tax=Actinophytocola sp. TaxID=1872138 RepID=UPI002DFF6B12|nr:DUF397 domain-containing protein [Actinophytocola sp.]